MNANGMKRSAGRVSISDTMLEALARSGTEPLIRYYGGFWTVGSCPLTDRGIPEWSVEIRTVRALEKRGYLNHDRSNPNREWCAPRHITDLGQEVLGISGSNPVPFETEGRKLVRDTLIGSLPWTPLDS